MIAYQTRSLGQDLERAAVMLTAAGIFVAHLPHQLNVCWVQGVCGNWTTSKMLGLHSLMKVISSL